MHPFVKSSPAGFRIVVFTLATFLAAKADDFEAPVHPYPYTELVLAPHAVLTATTPSGVMRIEAIDDLTRRYTWEGASRSVRLWPREERWLGSLGAYFPGEGEHWRNHNGITRGVLDEGRLNYKSEKEALDWLHLGMNQGMVWRGDGLAVQWFKVLDRRQLNVDVYQILIDGKKPAHLAGAQDDKIVLVGNEVPIP